MKRSMALMSASAIGLGSMAFAEDVKVDNVFVDVAPDAEQANVTTIFPNMAEDLQMLLDQKFAPHSDDAGFDVTIRIIEASVDGSMILTTEEEFNHLEGWVHVRPGDTGVADTALKPFTVTVDAQTGALYQTSEGMIVIPDAELFYVAMLNGFADLTVESVLEMQ